MIGIIITTKVKLSFKNYISNFMIKYIIYITSKLYDKKTTLGVVIRLWTKKYIPFTKKIV